MGNGEGSCVDGRLACHACGERHDSAIAKHLPDGSIVGLQSKEFALYCEAQYVLKIKGKDRRREYLERVEKARGMSGRDELQREIMRWFNVQKQGSVASSG